MHYYKAVFSSEENLTDQEFREVIEDVIESRLPVNFGVAENSIRKMQCILAINLEGMKEQPSNICKICSKEFKTGEMTIISKFGNIVHLDCEND